MEIKAKCFPYPVLSSYSDDYKNCEFSTTVDVARDGYDIILSFMAQLTEPQLKSLITSGRAEYVYHLECAQTGFRCVVKANKDSIDYRIADKQVCGKFQICPFITAKEDINGYTNNNFHDDYRDMAFDIEKGCIMAVGKETVVDIQKELTDFSDVPSVFSIVCNSDSMQQEMMVETESTKIIVKLPETDYYNYKSLSKNTYIQPLLNSLVIIPALTYALSEIKKYEIGDRDQLEQYAWYKAVKKSLINRFKLDVGDSSFDDENTLVLAQKLIGSPMSDALKFLTESNDSFGEAEE